MQTLSFPTLIAITTATILLVLQQPTDTRAVDIRAWLHSVLYTYDDETTHELAEFSEQDVTSELLNVNRTGLPQCDDNRLMLRLAQMQIISPERIVLLLFSTGGLVELCRTMRETIVATTADLRQCAPFEADNLYWLLFQGVGVMYRQMCLKETEMTEKLALHGSCIRDLREEFVDCEGDPDWFEKGNEEEVCRIFREIIDCQYVKTAELCGLEPANLMRCIALEVLNGSLFRPCTITMPVPRVMDPMPNLMLSNSRSIFTNKKNLIRVFIAALLYFRFQFFS